MPQKRQPPFLLFQNSFVVRKELSAAASTSISICADTAAVATAAEDKDEPDKIIISASTSAVIAVVAA